MHSHLKKLFLFSMILGSLNINFYGDQQVNAVIPSDPRDPLLNLGPKAEAVGKQVMVSTQSVIATEAALKVLSTGGNAIDAFITSVFLQHVTEYNQVMHFGCMAGLYFEASTGNYYAFNAVGERPLSSRNVIGNPMIVSIGGTVRGLEDLWRKFGTKTWPSYLNPAITAAEEGVLVTSFMYSQNYHLFEGRSLEQGRGDLTQNKEAREFYMPDGFLVPVGHLWKMPKFAQHLKAVAQKGADYLYTGDWAEKFVREVNKTGGAVTLEDMEEYQVRWETPLRFHYRDIEIVTEAPPVYGGLEVAYNLNILENFDLKLMGHYSESPDSLEVLARTFGRVSSEIAWLQDPLSFNVPVSLMLSKEYGRMGAAFVRNTMPVSSPFLGHLLKPSIIQKYQAPFHSIEMESSRDLAIGSCATVIVDGDGNWISAIHTGHGGAPGIFIDGVRATGSTMRSSSNGLGRRLLFPSAATFILKEGTPWMAMGTPGSPPQPMTEVILNIIDFDMSPSIAVDAPRFWAFQDLSRKIRIESRFSENVRATMRQRGIQIEDLGTYNWHTGSFQIIWKNSETGNLHGVTDPRRLGYTKGF